MARGSKPTGGEIFQAYTDRPPGPPSVRPVQCVLGKVAGEWPPPSSTGSRMGRAMLLPPLCACLACNGTPLPLFTHWIGGCVDSTACLDASKKRRNSYKVSKNDSCIVHTANCVVLQYFLIIRMNKTVDDCSLKDNSNTNRKSITIKATRDGVMLGRRRVDFRRDLKIGNKAVVRKLPCVQHFRVVWIPFQTWDGCE
jgi:hypothetical protein